MTTLTHLAAYLIRAALSFLFTPRHLARELDEANRGN